MYDTTGLVGEGTAHLPATDDCVQQFVIDRHQLAGSNRQFVQRRANDAVSYIECGQAVLARNAVAVLRIEIVISLVSDSARIVKRFGIRVGSDYVQSVAEAPSRFH